MQVQESPKTKVWLSRVEQIRRTGTHQAILNFLHLNESSGLGTENGLLQASDAARILECDLNVINFDPDIQNQLREILSEIVNMYKSAIAIQKEESDEDDYEDKEEMVVLVRPEHPYTSSQEL